jgi:hypothetical protein
MVIPGRGCRAPGRCQRHPREGALRIEAVRRVGYYQGRAGVPRLVAAHWGRRLRAAYLAGFRQGREDRLRDLVAAGRLPALFPTFPSSRLCVAADPEGGTHLDARARARASRGLLVDLEEH